MYRMLYTAVLGGGDWADGGVCLRASQMLVDGANGKSDTGL